MKSCNSLFLLFLFVYGKFDVSYCNVLQQTNSPQIYNLAQLVQNVAQNIHSINLIETFGNNVHENVLMSPIPNNNFKPDIIKLLKEISNDTNSCASDLIYVAENLWTKDIVNSWAYQMLDSFGKPETSILQGNVRWLGDFDECQSVQVPKQNFSGGFEGQYCLLQISPANQVSNMGFGMSLGICLPDTCHLTSEEFSNAINKIPFINKMTANMSVSTACKAKSRTLTSAATATSCIIAIFIFSVGVGSTITAIKYFSKARRNSMRSDSFPGPINHSSDDDILLSTEESQSYGEGNLFYSFVNCFCVFTNGSKLLNTDAREGEMLCLHGIRFLSMSWVILCHTYVFAFTAIRNMKSVINVLDDFSFQVILNGFFSVDSFFVLSAFLMCYLYLQEAEKRNGKIPWLYFYIHRYIRLTPVYMLVIGFFTTLLTYYGSGPMWPDYDIEPLCQKNWWYNILYINNFLNTTDMCMAWSWYLANDMQFFVISPLFLVTLYRWPKIGACILALFFVATWSTSFAISYQYNLFSGLSDITMDNLMNFMDIWTDYFDKLYIKPYTRIGPYLVGIVCGYLFFKHMQNNSRVSKRILWAGWIGATTIGLWCVYGLYHNHFGLVAASLYNAFSHTLFGISLSWVIFVCLTGHGGPVNKILSYKLFVPLSRLTYCAYLIHPIVVAGYFTSLRTTMAFSHTTMVFLFLGFLMATYAISFVVCLLFESPVIRLEKLCRSQQMKDYWRN